MPGRIHARAVHLAHLRAVLVGPVDDANLKIVQLLPRQSRVHVLELLRRVGAQRPRDGQRGGDLPGVVKTRVGDGEERNVVDALVYDAPAVLQGGVRGDVLAGELWPIRPLLRRGKVRLTGILEREFAVRVGHAWSFEVSEGLFCANDRSSQKNSKNGTLPLTRFSLARMK